MTTTLTLGEVIYIAVKPIFKIYMIIGVGFYLSRKNILTVDTARNISTIIIKILLPCLIFELIVTNITNDVIHEVATIILISVFMSLAQTGLVFAAGVALGCPRNWWGGLILCGLLPNMSDLPIAYLQTLQTADIFNSIEIGISYAMIFVAIQLFLQFTMGTYQLIEADFKQDLKEELKKNEFRDLEHADKNLTSSRESLELKQYSKNIQSNSRNSEMLHSEDYENSLHTENPEELHSIESYVIGHDSNSHDGEQMGKIRTHGSTSGLSRKTSKVSAYGNFIQNPNEGQKAEMLDEVVAIYSRYDELVQEQDLSALMEDEKNYKSKWEGICHSVTSIHWKKFAHSMLVVWKNSVKQPASISVVISIAIAMIPWLQALFVKSKQVQLPNAPDQLPPLSFIMDFAGYLGQAQVPFGLLMLGGTIGRLKVNKFPKRLWAIPISVVVLRLFIFPVIGCAFNSKLHKDGLFYGQDILYFISNINFCLPPATSLLYLTALYAPKDDKNHIQIDLLAIVYILHYIFLAICLPFVATYTIKVALKY